MDNIKEQVIAKNQQLRNIDIAFSKGILLVYGIPLKSIRKEMDNFISKQELCISAMQLEHKKINDVLEDIKLKNLFSAIGLYTKKLMNLKKEINSFHGKILKIKKRVIRFQQIDQ